MLFLVGFNVSVTVIGNMPPLGNEAMVVFCTDIWPIFLSFLLIPVFVRFVGRKTWFFVVGEKYFVAKIIQN